ncbi:MAG: EAL domain-containing protein [Xanthomonadales bacterium]|nr:EAL domain-containing protein [Xanthomonadales bacterium]MCB1633841.1 EAL domain-containing protein [Xanthomonadales bacterium]
MNTDAAQTSSRTEADVSRAREALKQHALTLARQWQALTVEGWNPAHGRGIQLAARQIVKASERLRLSLSRKAAELEEALRLFVETADAPESDQLAHLSGLISMLSSSALEVDLAPLQPDPAPARPQAPSGDAIAAARVVRRLGLVGLPESLTEPLAALAREQQLDLRILDNPQALEHETELPSALLFGASLIEPAAQLKRMINDSAGRLAQVHLALISDRRDLGRRLVANQLGLSFFEPPLDTAVLVESLGLTQGTTGGSKILLLDSDRNRGIEQAHWLQAEGCTVRLVMSTDELAAAFGEFRPNLVIVDNDLPVDEGLAAVQAVREWPGGLHLPIVVAGSSRDLRRREGAISAGADEYLIRPVRPRHLASVVSSRLDRARRWTARHAADAAAGKGLLVRSSFLQRLRQWTPRREAGVLFVTLDGADSLRRELGLAHLQAVDQLVTEHLAPTLGAADLLGQFQDFCYLVAAERTERHELMVLGEALRQSLEKVRGVLAGKRCELRCSVGVAPLKIEQIEQSVDQARAAALAAQNLGGNRSLAYDEGSNALKPAGREARAGAVLARPEEQPATMLGQPLLPVSARVAGQFLLTPCWPSAQNDQSALSYADVVKLGGDPRRLLMLDRRLILQALDLRANQLAKGRQLRLLLELHPGQLAHASFMPWLAAELKRRKLSGSGLALVLPSSLLVDHLEGLKSVTDSLHRLGVRVALGDFGRDLAAVPRLKLANVDLVLLAPEAVRSDGGQIEESALCGLIRRAQDANVQVVAREVERRDALASVERLGVDYVLSNTIAAPSTEFDFDFRGWTG